MVRLGGEPESGNFEDRTGQSGGIGFGGGGGGLGLLLSLVGSRFGIVGILVLLLGYCALTSLGGLGGGGGGTSGASKLDPNVRDALVRILGSTEQTWGEIFQKSGAQYQPTTLVAYTGGTQTACGMGQAAMGPFYCPNDKKIYVDPAFFNELATRFQSPGDFPIAYVIAHGSRRAEALRAAKQISSYSGSRLRRKARVRFGWKVDARRRCVTRSQ